MAVAAVIFDFDGLLRATESTMLASWQYEWRQHGLELDTATFWADHGGDVSQERYRLLAQAVGPSYDQARSHARWALWISSVGIVVAAIDLLRG